MQQLSSYNELMAVARIGDFADEEAVSLVGRLIDASDDAGKEDGLVRALQWSGELEKRPLSEHHKLTLSYYRANVAATRYRRDVDNTPAAWAWDQPYYAFQIFDLRQALNNSAFDQEHPMRRCQILTNLANCLSTVGRFVEALELYSRALEIEPRFWEALGNRGAVYLNYGKLDPDKGHSVALFVKAHDDLEMAIKIGEKNVAMNPGALQFFKERIGHLLQGVNVEAARAAFALDG